MIIFSFLLQDCKNYLQQNAFFKKDKAEVMLSNTE